MFLHQSSAALVMLFVAAAVSELEYDETAALRQVKLAEAAYCVSDVGNWTCAVCVDNIQLVSVVEANGTVRALVGYDREVDALFVSYRGTSNLDNWMDDFDILFEV